MGQALRRAKADANTLVILALSLVALQTFHHKAFPHMGSQPSLPEECDPAPEVALDLAPRLNLITGDNGLDKSFLLDVAWYCLTRRWPQRGESRPEQAPWVVSRS